VQASPLDKSIIPQPKDRRICLVMTTPGVKRGKYFH
jgi:hypothetical protein